MKVLIIGGGIGGFATALSLHAVGLECEVFEQGRAIRDLGAGSNMLPHAVKELAALGLLEALDRVAIRTSELIYTNRFGQEIWREPRGLDAGYAYPQFSIHRGRLQGVLHAATRARIGEDGVRTAHQLVDVDQGDRGVTATFLRRDGSGATVTARGDVLIAADGIHSTVRRRFYRDEGPPTWNGMMLWRGAVEHPPFLTGRSMIIAGGRQTKLVLYPISNQTRRPGTNLLNWVVVATQGDRAQPPPRREDWGRLGWLDEFLPHVAGIFHLPQVDPVEAIRATPECYEYPMCDRDPLPRWSFGRVTLLGDAAHPMYPVGSNGASQAILDACWVARVLAETKHVVPALHAYEAARRPATAKIVQENRAGGPERVIDVIEARAPDRFANLADVASHAELEAIVKGYARQAGFDQQQVNRGVHQIPKSASGKIPRRVLMGMGLVMVGVIASSAPALGAPRPLAAANFRLQASGHNPVIADLDAALPKASVAAVVDSANRTGASCRPHPDAVAAFCWERGDDSTTEWYPQGITTSADASADGQYEDKTVVLVSWYYSGGGDNKGVRASFVDYSNPSAPRYRHVLLVEPYRDATGNPNFRAVPVHAGGIFWYGHYLYVADTWGGFRVFDTRHIWEVSTGDKDKIGRQSDGSYHAHDYAYALPQALTFAASTTGGYAALRYSAVSLDRTSSPPSVIVPEYDAGGTGTRVVRYPIDESTLMLKPSDDGYVHGSEAYQVDIPSMQGATAIDGKFYVSASRGATTRGSVYTFTEASGPTAHAGALPPGPEDLSYWRTQDLLWTLAEHPGQRSVLAVKASSF